MRMLRETRYSLSMVHAVRLLGVEVLAVASPRRFHIGIAGWVEVLVIDTEEEGVEGLEREA